MILKKFQTLTAFERLAFVTICLALFFLSVISVQCTYLSRLSSQVGDLREKFDGVSNQIASDKLSLREELQAIRNDTNLDPATKAVSAIAAVGIRWTESSGKVSYSWKGTSFAIAGTDEFATAAHVLEGAQKEVTGLIARGIQAEIVCRLSSGVTTTCVEARYHPRYHESHVSVNRPAIDIAVFSISSDVQIQGLSISNRAPKIGEQVIVPGFPTVIEQIKYDIADDNGFGPTVRVGRVERIASLRSLASGPPHELIQCNVPFVGGFSGAPMLNSKGEVMGIAVFSVHRALRASELPDPQTIPNVSNTTRIVDPSHVSFAISIEFLSDLISSGKSD